MRRIGARRAATWLASVALALAGALAEPEAAGAQDEAPARLIGRVTDSAGRPLKGARVHLVRAGEADAPRTAESQPSGGFQFAGLPAGTYRLRVEKPGFRSRERGVEVRAGRVRTLVVRLPRGEGSVRVPRT